MQKKIRKYVSDMKVERVDTKYSRREKITWIGIKPSHSGIYECHMTNFEDNLKTAIKLLNIEVYGEAFQKFH